MQFFKKTTEFDFMTRRKFFLALSGIAVLLCLVAIFGVGPKFGIDFMGGTEIQVNFKEKVESAQIRNTLTKLGFIGSDVQTFGAHESEYLIRLQAISAISDEQAKEFESKVSNALKGNKISRFEVSPGGDKLTVRIAKEIEITTLESVVKDAGFILAEKIEEPVAAQKVEDGKLDESADEEEGGTAKYCESVTCTWPHQDMRIYEVNLKGVTDRVMDGLRAEPFGAGAVKMRSEWVGPKVGDQLRVAGVSSLGFALLFIMLYIAVRFDLRFAPGAVVALIHDVIITLGIFTVLRIDVTLATVAALLTVVGYSLNDTIVVFDRIRENLGKVRERKMEHVINLSINQTLSRTILTSMTTLLVVTVLLTVGWNTTIRDFAVALLIGVLIGTYSSIFVASPVVAWLDTRFSKKKA